MLPQYSKQYKSEDIDLEDGANEQLLGRTSTETAPPTYPPSSSGSGARSNVQYHYNPQYPRSGDYKTAVGVLGQNKLVESPFLHEARLTPRKRLRLYKKDSQNWPNSMKTESLS
jgi:hypothetical protein